MTPDDHLLLIVDDISWKFQEGADNNAGIYKVTFGEIHALVNQIKGRDLDWKEFDDLLAWGLDNRWFRLSAELHRACLRWRTEGKQIEPELEIWSAE